MKGMMRARRALCVAEKPSVAKAAAYFLNFKAKGNNFAKTVSSLIFLVMLYHLRDGIKG